MILSLFTLYYLIAISVQIFLMVFMRKQGIGTWKLYSIGALFVTSNVIIFCGFFIPRNAMNFEILLRLFYAISSLWAACFLSHAIEVRTTKESDFIIQIENGVWIVGLCNAILAMFTDEFIMGYKPLSFTATAVQGDNFWIFRAHIILAQLTALVVLIKEFSSVNDRAKKTHCLCIIVAYLATILSSLVVTTMIHYGLEINLDTTLPFFTTFTLSLITYGNFKYGWVSRAKPIQKQNEMSEAEQLHDIFIRYKEGAHSFTEATEKFDRLLLSHSYKKYNGNMQQTAKAMGLGRSTLYKKMQKYNLK